MEEKQMIFLLKSRDSSGMDEFCRRYDPMMRYIIAPILPDWREQEECLSDVHMKVWDKIVLYDEERGSFKSWLTVITRNTALNRARHNRHLDSDRELSDRLTDRCPTPEDQLLHEERLDSLKKAMETLSDGDRLILYRKYYYRQSTAQIAAELGMTQRAVEGRLYRLKQKLRAQMTGGDGHA